MKSAPCPPASVFATCCHCSQRPGRVDDHRNGPPASTCWHNLWEITIFQLGKSTRNGHVQFSELLVMTKGLAIQPPNICPFLGALALYSHPPWYNHCLFIGGIYIISKLYGLIGKGDYISCDIYLHTCISICIYIYRHIIYLSVVMYRTFSCMFLHPSAFASGCAGIHELPLSNIEAGQIHTRVADEAQVQVCWYQKLLACASGQGNVWQNALW